MYSNKLFFVCMLVASCLSTGFSQTIVEVIDDIRYDIEQYVPKVHRDRFYELYYDTYGLLDNLDLNSLIGMLSHGKATNETCHMCNNLLTLGKTFLQNKEILNSFVGSMCDKTEAVSSRVCHGLLDRLGDPLLYILHNTKLTIPEACSVFFGHGCTTFLNIGKSEKIYWELPLPEKKEFKPINFTDDKTKKLLQLTDVHLDLWYTGKSNSRCNEPLCCRSTTYENGNETFKAGHWGEVNGVCDIPLNFVIDSLRHIGNTHKDIEYVFWTGDNVPHDIWNTTMDINLRHIHMVTGLVNVAFNDKSIVPVLGNHEAHPINMYVPHEVSLKTNFTMKWLYETLANDYWARWIDTKEAKETFTKGGYYSKMLTPSWKAIVLNSNHAYKANFWVGYDPVDPDGQLAWLIKELDEAEKIGAYVSILGHIPPKEEMYDAWIHNYIRIVDRYSHLITASYNGHTHNDEFTVLYNKDKKPVGINYISGSLTTYSYLNPSYKIFEVDSKGQPLDFEMYFSDLDKVNAKTVKTPSAVPEWQLEYQAKKSYRLDDLTPASWGKFVDQAETEIDLAYLYFEHFHRFSTEFPIYEKYDLTKVENLIKQTKVFSPFDEE